MAVAQDAAIEREVRADLDARVYDRASVDEDAVARIKRWLDRRCDLQRDAKVPRAL
jgi:hypothetical protein